MTYTIKRYKSYQEFHDDELPYEKNYRLLSTGEAIEVSEEYKLNIIAIAYALIEAILQSEGISLIRFLRRGDQEIEVRPLGDRWINRKPDLVLLQPEHLGREKSIFLGMSPPRFAAEVVSLCTENSDNYQRDYVWK